MNCLLSEKQKQEKYYQALGEGGWIGNDYVVSVCPLCDERLSFNFAGLTGVWRCSACNKHGKFEDLKELLKDDLLFIDKIATLDEPSAPEGLIQIGKYVPPKKGRSVATGFGIIDQKISGLYEGALTVLSGKRGEGKSTIASQFALNVINAGARVCFYSGELNAAMFQSWIIHQAAGKNYLQHYVDDFGADRYMVDSFIEGRIKSWLIDKLILYDNTCNKSSERNAIIDRFLMAKRYYNCNVFFVDNLMTAKYTKDTERDYYRQQSNFVGELVDFAQQEKAHIILIAHPKKEDTGDENNNVSGVSDITNRASNVFTVHRLTPEEKRKSAEPMDSLITLSKNRDYGALAKMGFTFDVPSRRFIPNSGKMIEIYQWELDL